MYERPRSLRLALIACTLALGACTTGDQPSSREPSSEAEATDASAGEPSTKGGAGVGSVGNELPPELVADLRMQGSDADGRLLTLASGFIATAECSDCGAPNYLWFLAVRCADSRHCEVLTEQCEGNISREDESYTIEFRPVEGAPGEVCASYSGTFERP